MRIDEFHHPYISFCHLRSATQTRILHVRAYVDNDQSFHLFTLQHLPYIHKVVVQNRLEHIYQQIHPTRKHHRKLYAL